MKRNSTTLFLESPGATTPIPWVDNAPDFTGFAEPTLSILQSAWNGFLESGEPLEIVPDPATPEPVPQPQWTAFNTAMLTDPYWQSWSIPHDLRVAIISSAIGANTDAFQTAYDLGASIVPPSAEAINDWQTMADTFSIPVTFNPF